MIIIIGIAEAIGTITYYIGLEKINAVNASILGNSELLFVIVIAIIFFRGNLKKNEILPFSLIMIGTVIIPIISEIQNENIQSFDFTLGEILILISGIFYAIDITLSNVVCRDVDSIKIMQGVCLSGAFLTLLILIVSKISLNIQIEQIPWIVVIGIFGMGISSLCFIQSLKIIGTTRLVIISSTGVIFAAIFSNFYLYETIKHVDLINIIIVIIGVYLIRKKYSN